jgi:hypothetical protein
MACQECAKGSIESRCDIHVACDDACEALREPETLEELRDALFHWESHGLLSGCSHGC